MTGPRDDFRRYVLDVYGSEGVATASVLLQDRRGVDVNVLLAAAFVGAAMGMSFTNREFEAASARTRRWQDDVVVPLRKVRMRLKDGPSPAPNATTAALRDRIKAVELDAEMVELGELADFVAHLDAPAAQGDAEERATSAMQVVIGHVAAGKPSDDETHAIAVIASAAARFGGG
jgi:uncharacterized protein (TIGR02444 family)